MKIYVFFKFFALQHVSAMMVEILLLAGGVPARAVVREILRACSGTLSKLVAASRSRDRSAAILAAVQ